MTSIRGRKLGLIVKVISILTWIPWGMGVMTHTLFKLNGGGSIAIYVLGWLIMLLLGIIIYILRAVLIWFTDDTGEQDPWNQNK